MSSTRLRPAGLVELVSIYRDAVAEHAATINRLNVFPVPDGDTGTNMLATLDSVVADLGTAATAKPTMSGVCAVIARASLMGARGNSGVILCQYLRGLCEVLGPLESAGPRELVAALEQASTLAYAAVHRPVEGTILTVAAGAAGAARAALGTPGGEDLLAVCRGARSGAAQALRATPSLLPVLREAKVVDAGGAGLLLLFEAACRLAGEDGLPISLELPEEVAAVIEESHAAAPHERASASSVEPFYEVMYLLEAPDAAIGRLREAFAALGDSIVVVGGNGLFNCHVHTKDIGGAIEAGITAGRPYEIRVSDLREQVEEEQWVRSGGAGTEEGPPPVTSVVAVSSGEGLRRILSSLGAHCVVEGGQSMNPSTAELLEAVDSTRGAGVVLLPNNANIVAVAREAAKLSAKEVLVVETRSVQEALAALVAYDPQAAPKENAEAMAAFAGHVVAGEVTRAVRAATTPAGEVAPGDWIGLSERGVLSASDTLAGAAVGLLSALLTPSHELVTLIEGAGVPEGATDEVAGWLSAEHPGLSLERLNGGQPVYPLLVALE